METTKPNSATITDGSRKLAIGWLTMFVIGSDLFVVSPLLPLIASDYAVSTTSVALSVTIFALAYMLSAPLLGRLADRIGAELVLGYCLCGFAAANLLTAAASNLNYLLVTRFFAGAAAAGVSPSLYALIGASAPPRRRATWLAVVVSGLLVSLALGAPLGLLAAASRGWQSVFTGLGVSSAILLWANNRVWRNCRAGGQSAERSGRFNPGVAVARLAPTVIWSIAVYAMYTYLGLGLTSLGYTTGAIAEAILFYGFGAISGVLLGGRMADRLGSRLTSTIGLCGLCLSLLLLRLALGFTVLVGCALGLVSLTGQLFFPAQQVRLANEFPARRATVLAWNNSALFLGIALGSAIGGRALSLGGYDLDLMIAEAATLLAWGLNWAGYRSRVSIIAQSPQPSGAQPAR